MTAYSKALAGESISDAMNAKWDPESKTYIGLTFDELERYTRTIAYKVAHNLSLGFTMDPANDPLTYVDCGKQEAEIRLYGANQEQGERVVRMKEPWYIKRFTWTGYKLNVIVRNTDTEEEYVVGLTPYEIAEMGKREREAADVPV